MNINGRPTAIADSNGLRYYSEDLEWACEPTKDDPGFLIPKQGCYPVDEIPDSNPAHEARIEDWELSGFDLSYD